MVSVKTIRILAGRTVLASGLALSAGCLLAGVLLVRGGELLAQQRGPVQRVVQGKVQDKSGASLKGAVVYLQDGRTQAVKSAITTDDGSYRFGQLTQNTDYQLWASLDGKKSKTKSISSFDSKNEFTINIVIDK